jgi:hypothetical protein
MIGFTIIFQYFNNDEIAPYFSLCILPFVLPEFLKVAFQYYLDIPNDIYKLWYYPTSYDESNLEQIDLEKAYMLEFEFTTSNNGTYTNSKMRAPVNMKFGDWFKAYIDYHNEKYDNNRIEYVNEDGTPQAWMFLERGTLLTSSRHIDAEKTILDNKLSEKKVIIIKRVNEFN